MSALPPKADIRPRDPDVCFGPTTEVGLGRACPSGLLCSRMANLGEEEVGQPAADTATTDKTAADKVGSDKSADDASAQGP
jgi:hypothetical protein